MKRVLIAVAVLLFSVGNVLANTLTAEWTSQSTLANQIDGTRIYQDTATTAPVASVTGVAVNKASFSAPTDGKCHNYFARNHKGGVESANSNVILWCPPNVDPPPAVQPPVGVGGFKIITTVEPLK
jgi:hypothetical protein